MPTKTTISGQNVKILRIKQELHGELSDKIHYECAFCSKTVAVYPITRRVCERLSGQDSFYCQFCLRRGHNTKNSRHILPLSFRALIGYFYYEKYSYGTRTMWLNDLRDIAASHVDAGLINPVFDYDYDTMMWFVNFAKVGRGRRKIKLNDVLKTILSILASFDISKNSPSVDCAKFYQKYAESIKAFYEQRYRPDGKPALIPTLSGCGVYDTNKKYSLDRTRSFTYYDMVETNYSYVHNNNYSAP